MSDRQWVYYITDPLPANMQDAKELLGGKGASLQAMSRAGLSVPPGFVISTECCRYFFDHDGAWPPGLEDQVRRCLERLERDTGRTFGSGARPLFVSVRSGAAVSMPGMMDTLLNCGLWPGLAEQVGGTHYFWLLYVRFIVMFAETVAGVSPSVFGDILSEAEEAAGRPLAERCMALYEENAGRPFPSEPWPLLVECINAVFNSWHNERAVVYRRQNSIEGLIGTGVTVQAMFPSQVSGIMFTHDPNDVTAHRMIIEGSYGLGETIVSGEVTPDRFFVNRDDFADMRTVPGHKVHVVRALGDENEYAPESVCLTPEQIAELCELAVRVESFFDMPVDIEWGWADGEFALLQSRPIRGLDIAHDVEVGRLEEISRLRALAGDRHRVWVIHNLAETLRAPTPLTWDIIRRFMSGSGGFGLMYRDFGYQPSELVRREGFLALIGGNIYADPDRLAHLFWDGVPLSYDVDAILADKGLLDRAPTRFEADKVEPSFLLKLPRIAWSALRSSRVLKRTGREAADAFEREALPPYLEYVQAARRQDLSALAVPQLIEELHARRRRVLDEFGKESLKPGFFGGMALAALAGLLARFMGEEEGIRLATTLTSALEGDLTFEQDVLLYRVARGEATLDEFLDKFGHRAFGEMELAQPRWREDRAWLEQLIGQLKSSAGHSPEDVHRNNVHKRETAEQELAAELEACGGSSFREEIEEHCRRARRLLPYRETGKYYLMMGYELIRTVILEVGRRLGIGDDVFFLRLDEIEEFEDRREELVEEIQGRRIRWQSLQRLDMPDVIDSADLRDLGLPGHYEAAGELEGEAVAAGVATGRARIVVDPRDTGDLGVDYILICPSTDPGWTSLFINARGLIVERGGMLSHGAIVARDFGIPAVVCPHATRLIQDGAMVQVDGNHGRITVIEED